ncbi:hypothetical protein [Streptomyces sp. NPDC090021]|uniref:hypothetical protein n=1 Tax=Streptomyces sp. NPDC090021 TaxID=3365919 RepID=UPI0037FD4F4A
MTSAPAYAGVTSAVSTAVQQPDAGPWTAAKAGNAADSWRARGDQRGGRQDGAASGLLPQGSTVWFCGTQSR